MHLTRINSRWKVVGCDNKHQLRMNAGEVQPLTSMLGMLTSIARKLENRKTVAAAMSYLKIVGGWKDFVAVILVGVPRRRARNQFQLEARHDGDEVPLELEHRVEPAGADHSEWHYWMYERPALLVELGVDEAVVFEHLQWSRKVHDNLFADTVIQFQQLSRYSTNFLIDPNLKKKYTRGSGNISGSLWVAGG